MKNVYLYSVLCFAMSLYSCQNRLLMCTAGIHAPDPVNDQMILEMSKRFGIRDENVCALNTNRYTLFTDSIKKSSPETYKDLMQPLQIKYFRKSDSLTFHLINGNVGGFPNLKWNRLKSFDVYPPKPSGCVGMNCKLRFSKDSLLYRPLFFCKPMDDSDATIVVFWSRMMGRQSKRLIREAMRYRSTFNQYRIRLIFVNNDNLYI